MTLFSQTPGCPSVALAEAPRVPQIRACASSGQVASVVDLVTDLPATVNNMLSFFALAF
jgi:hypothetical protein